MLKIPPNQKTSQVTEKMDPKYTIGRYYTWSTRTQLAIVFCHELPTSSTATTFYPVFCGEHGCSKVVQLFLLLPKKNRQSSSLPHPPSQEPPTSTVFTAFSSSHFFCSRFFRCCCAAKEACRRTWRISHIIKSEKKICVFDGVETVQPSQVIPC